MDRPLVSVIIPVYNSDGYLERCMDSIIKQTYSELEIIPVDDGSSDNSLSILKRYEKEDSRIRVIEAGINMGQSAARNKGLDNAGGEWIVFMDSDDEAAPDMIESLLIYAVDSGAQICAGSYSVHNMSDGTEFVKSVGTKTMSGREAFGYLFCDRLFMIVCSCIFRKELFENYVFPVGKIYEDSYMLAHVLLDSDVCACIDKVVYYYYMRGSGTALGSDPLKRMDQLWVMREIEEYAEKKSPEYVDKVYHYTFMVCSLLLERIYQNGIKEYKECWLKAEEEFLISSKNIRKKYLWERIGIALFHVSPMLFIIVRKLYGNFKKITHYFYKFFSK